MPDNDSQYIIDSYVVFVLKEQFFCWGDVFPKNSWQGLGGAPKTSYNKIRDVGDNAV